jgi:hypothetical protein
MVRPLHFDRNEQTAATNLFQSVEASAPNQQVVQMVVHEFNHFVKKLRNIGTEVVVFDDLPNTPDAVFPNNWFTTHTNGQIITYPMLAQNRRSERRMDILEHLETQFEVAEIIPLHEHFEANEQYLEGTGSMVLDRINGIVYACRSPRTNEAALTQWSKTMGYHPFLFDAHDAHGEAVYHTNVVLSIGEGFAVVCLEAISNDTQKQQLLQLLTETEHEIIDITQEQMSNFAANVLQVQNQSGELVLVMSEQAYLSLHQHQLVILHQYNEHILHTPLYTIEKYGGGSARCMLAEVFLQKKNDVDFPSA